MPINLNAKLISKKYLKSNMYKFSMQADEIVNLAKPGQFIEIRVNNDIEPFLRRPISIHNIDKEKGLLEIIFQVRGKGTRFLSEKNEGDFIDIIGPLGYGTFKYNNYNNLAIIGGGIGVFPLYELAKNAKNDNKNVNIYVGFRNKDLVVLADEFKSVSDKLIVTTNDGSYGEKGHCTKFMKDDMEKGLIDSIYACGPLPMLRSIKEMAAEKNIPCQISLEERMACGLGVCLGCAVKTSSSTNENPEYWHVCKAGPVFNAKDVDF